jgi:hypothetical protein
MAAGYIHTAKDIRKPPFAYPVRRRRAQSWITALLIIIPLALASCAPGPPRLRISNQGQASIQGLHVLFPEDEIEFGDVPAGATTAYADVPNGIYAYAAYRFIVDGEEITQPVIDWVGEEPMDGEFFTYTIAYDPAGPPIQKIQLLEVTQDE